MALHRWPRNGVTIAVSLLAVQRRAVTAFWILAACAHSRVPAKPAPTRGAARQPPTGPSGPTLRPGECPASSIAKTRAAPVFITLRRESCFGSCPVYQLTIDRDGQVHYAGTRFVKTCAGEERLSPSAMAELEALFRTKRFLDLDAKYIDRRLSDATTVFTSYESTSGAKEVEHYLGDRTAPQALGEIEDGIDRIVNIEQWIGTDDERMQIYLDYENARP